MCSFAKNNVFFGLSPLKTKENQVDSIPIDQGNESAVT